ncbi:hypothetical protein QQF64_019419, partial [Cirrhinus molitorella]
MTLRENTTLLLRLAILKENETINAECCLASWSTLRAEFVHLNPAQLHHMLREYNTARTCPPCWTPSPEDSAASLNTSNILESFDNHPPLILPSSIFNLELGNPITEPGLFTPLRHLQEFIQSLPDSQTQSDHQPSQGSCGNLTEETASEAIIVQDSESKDQNLSAWNSKTAYLGIQTWATTRVWPRPLCLRPPPTPQSLEQAELEAGLLEGVAQQTTRQHRKVENGITGNQKTDEDEDDRDEVFTVELMRGPHGLGLALVDGMCKLLTAPQSRHAPAPLKHCFRFSELSIKSSRANRSEPLLSPPPREDNQKDVSEGEIEQLTMGVFITRKDGGEPHESPSDFGIVIEGVKVLSRLTSVTSACVLLL